MGLLRGILGVETRAHIYIYIYTYIFVCILGFFLKKGTPRDLGMYRASKDPYYALYEGKPCTSMMRIQFWCMLYHVHAGIQRHERLVVMIDCSTVCSLHDNVDDSRDPNV